MTGYIGFDLGVSTLSVYDRDGFLGIQPDLFGDQEEPGIQPYELHHPYGFASRPLDPSTDAQGHATLGCAVLYGMEGGKGHAWLSSDPRVSVKLPPLKKGGSMQYAATGAYAIFDGDDGTYTLYVPYGGKAHLFEISAKSGAVTLRNGSGAGFVLTDEGVTVNSPSGSAWLQVTDDGIVCNGNMKVNGGFSLGGPAGAVPLMLSTLVPSTMATGI